MKKYKLNIAGVSVSVAFLFPETKTFFDPYVAKEEEGEPDIYVPQDYFLSERQSTPVSIADKWVEDYCLIGFTSRYLLQYNRCLFHGAAFCIGNEAWILTGPSGIGKTTQLRNLLETYKGRIELINGDKPALELRDDESFMIHPSPWNGKEEYCGSCSAPLKGIILLEQGKCNKIKRISQGEAVIPIYYQFLYFGKLEPEIRQVSRMEDALLRNYPVYRFINTGKLDSTEKLFQFISSCD